MDSVAIVTGGAGGLGALIVRGLSRLGYHVVIADTDVPAAERLVTEVRHEGGEASSVETDASDPDQIRRMVDRAAGLGPVRVLVNNAGGWLPGPQFPDTDGWRRSMDLNLVMPMLATQLCLPLMTQAGDGAVVNISSSGGWDSRAYGSPEYGAAKAGLIRFTTAVTDWAERFGVRVNCVVPHWIGLERARREFEQMTVEQQRESGGLVAPSEVVAAVMQLITDHSRAGQVLVLRGQTPGVEGVGQL